MKRAPNAWDRFYRQHQAPWRGERNVRDWLPLLGGGPVLELGAGNGKTLKPLRAEGIEVVALEISWHALCRLDGPRVLANAAVLPFANQAFSAVLDLHCTGHLAETQRAEALSEAYRVTKPGGSFIQERLGPGDLRATQGMPSDGGRTLQDGRHTWFLGEDTLRNEAATAGWAVVSTDIETRTPRLRTERVTRQHISLVAKRD